MAGEPSTRPETAPCWKCMSWLMKYSRGALKAVRRVLERRERHQCRRKSHVIISRHGFGINVMRWYWLRDNQGPASVLAKSASIVYSGLIDTAASTCRTKQATSSYRALRRVMVFTAPGLVLLPGGNALVSAKSARGEIVATPASKKACGR